MARTSFTAGLVAHLQEEVTTVCNLLEIIRRDGTTIYLTDLDVDVVFDGNTYLGIVGFDRTALSASEGFDADSADINAFVDEDGIGGITRDDLARGLYVGASYVLRIVNYKSPDTDNGILRTGRIGDILEGQSGRLVLELDSLTGQLQIEGGELYSATCRADLGDSRCKVPLEPPLIERNTNYNVGQFVRVITDTGATGQEQFENRIYEVVTAGTTDGIEPTFDTTVGNDTVDGTATFRAFEAWTREGAVDGAQTSARVFTTLITEARAVDNWFQFGVITFESGPNINQSREIKSWTQASGTVETYLPFPFVPEDGDIFRITPGCAKTRGTCTGKFVMTGSTNFNDGNIFNFRGEPDLPGEDYVFTYPDAQ